MKRRDFLKAPAYGVLLGGNLDLTKVPPGINAADAQRPPMQVQQEVEQRMHPDFITYLPGVEYFFFGNGEITGVVQHSPKDTRATFLGFTIMNPGLFSRKWSTYLYHPERGFTNTRLGVTLDESGGQRNAQAGMYHGVRGFSVTPENFKSIQWTHVEGIPIVSLLWMAGECEVEEEFFAPSEGSILFRRATVRNLSSKQWRVGLSLSLYANFGLFDQIFTDESKRAAFARGLARMKLFALGKNATVSGRYDVRVDVGDIAPGSSKQATYVYALNDGEKIFKMKTFLTLWNQSVAYWSEKSTLESGNKMVDDLWSVSKAGLRAVLGNNGRMDAGVWQYNMEWVIDHMWAAIGFLRSGFVDEARLLVERNLATAIGHDGRTIESSRWFGYDYTELNQNGSLVYSVWEYLCWTGDFALVKKYWDKIKLCAEFPFKEVFFDKQAKMVRNKREFWERSDSFGIEDGYEMAYQFWVISGLEKGAEMARALGEQATARKWRQVASEMKGSFLCDPTFKMVEDGHFIKRRKRDGQWQKYCIPPDRRTMPPGSPLALEQSPMMDPDTVEVFPIIYGMIDPRSELSLKTLEWVDTLWSQRWDGGGYPRYNTYSEPDPPAPWPLASVMVARGHAEAGNDDKVWRVLNWISNLPGGKSGSWFERYGPSITPPAPPVGIVGWIWYEIMALYVHQIIGLRPELDRLLVRPRLITGLDKIRSTHTVRGTKVTIHIRRSKDKSTATVNGKETAIQNGSLIIPYPKRGTLTIDFSIAG
jgi:hypothetical protein